MLIKKNILKILLFLTSLKKLSIYIFRLHWIFLISLKVLINLKKSKQLNYFPFKYILEIKNENICFGNLDIFYIKQLLINFNIFFKCSIFVFKKKIKKWTVLRSVFVHSTSKETLFLSKWKIRICFETKFNNYFIHNFFIYKIHKILENRSSNFIYLKSINNSKYNAKKSNTIRFS